MSPATTMYRVVFLVFWGITAGLFPSQTSQAAIEIVTADGRVLRGEVDSRSDSQTLWIRSHEGQIILSTAVAWKEIASARIDGQETIVAELPTQIPQLKTVEPQGFLTEYEVLSRPSLTDGNYFPKYFHRNQVASLEIDASIVNLDRTVEPDGIVLAVAPLDGHGQILPLCGNLTVRLWGEISNQHTGIPSFVELERWTARITEPQFADHVPEVRLRFRQIRPEFDLPLCTSALVNARLGVPGAGNFEASAPIDLRTFNPYRERLQYYEGSRFFSNELTHNTRQIGFQGFSRGFVPSTSDW